MNREDDEWDLLDRRLQDQNRTPIATPQKRITIYVDDIIETQLQELITYERPTVSINTNVIVGLEKTQERIEVTLIMTDEGYKNDNISKD